MTEHARVVVVGGGILGCSLLYQLARLGERELLLIEKDELTSGVTWHAAGQLILAEADAAVSRINILSRSIYDALEAETGQPIGLHRTGCMELATSREKLASLRHMAERAGALGIDYQVLGPREVLALCPLMDPDGILGAGYAPHEGHVDPAQATQAFAAGARAAGAVIRRHTRVTAIARHRGGEWRVTTDAGEVLAEQVVLAGGFWSPDLARFAGADLPIVTVERQYLVTEAIPELAGRETRIPIVCDHDVPFYFRQEGEGLMFGVYEDRTPFCFTDGIPADFAHELLPPDLERGERFLAAGMRRVPAFARAGVKRVICGPTSRTPDFQGLLGPLAGVPGLWVLAGFSAGISQGAGVGRLLAEWLVEGEPSLDVAPVDVNRFGDHATPDHVRAVVAAVRGYGSPAPEGEPTAGRPARVGPLHATACAQGARFGSRDGYERALWFAGAEPADDPREVRRAVRRECAAARGRVAVIDETGAAVLSVSGVDAAARLSTLLARPLPPPGANGWNFAETRSGGIACAFAVAHLLDGQVLLRAPARARHHHRQWLESRLGDAPGARLDDLSDATAVIRLLGPRAPDLVRAAAGPVAGRDVPATGQARRMVLGHTRAVAIGGELGGLPTLDLLVPTAAAAPLHERMASAGGRAAPRMVGLFASESLRVAAGVPTWGLDLGPAVPPAALGPGAPGAGRLCRIAVAGGDRRPRPGDLLVHEGGVVGSVGSTAHSGPASPGRWLLLALLPEAIAASGTVLRLADSQSTRRVRVLGPCPPPA